ncbi:MAG: ABC transporter permease [Planctomycetota bacterium]|jgi:ABC-type transport system involved in multi-copper enzyme maturation permease subunit
MQLWAIIVDSLRESRDRKIFWVLLGISALILLVMLSIGFPDNRVTFLFGAFEQELQPDSILVQIGPSFVVGWVVSLVFEFLVGWVGVILMIVATASVFPSIIESGVVGVLLSKPISRPRLFLYKYLSAMVFVTVQAGFVIGGSFLVMGLRWGIWRPGYLLAIPALVLLFSYIFGVSVLVGLKTRSAVASVLVSLFAWIVFAGVHQLPQVFELFPTLKERTAIYNTVKVISWIPPKTGDLTYFVMHWADTPPPSELIPLIGLSPEEQRQMKDAAQIEKAEMKKSPWLSIGSSLAFEGSLVLLGMWMFSRRDY